VRRSPLGGGDTAGASCRSITMHPSPLEQRLASLSASTLAGMRRGVEKESLRSHRDGRLALTPHPAALGSALKHPCITTDYSESQLELITGAHTSVEACVGELRDIHQFVTRALDGEMLWASSMPCDLPADETIPIGRYGTSNVGRAKSVYRMGLANRYGRRMQTISGIHYNWSLPGLHDDDYFALIRNFRRHAWLLLLLFGASPAVGSSFVDGRPHPLVALARGEAGVSHTLGLPHATSLRMGRLGYQSEAQATLAVSYNCLDSYAASLHDALTTPYPAYEAVGIMNPGGEYNQLATTLLQIENEFYSTIRPKRTIRPGERPLHALRDRGVEYIEVRCMDLDPFEPLGIGASTMHFLDVFLVHALLAPSDDDSPVEIAALASNQERTAARGREPGLALMRVDGEVGLRTWGDALLDEFDVVARALDAAHGGRAHGDAVAHARAGLHDPASLPSARVLAAMHRDFGDSHIEFVRTLSHQTKRSLLELPWSGGQDAHFRALAAQSISDQKAAEAADAEPFEAFRQRYVDPGRLYP
jgi:glutamate--cysteine ligase